MIGSRDKTKDQRFSKQRLFENHQWRLSVSVCFHVRYLFPPQLSTNQKSCKCAGNKYYNMEYMLEQQYKKLLQSYAGFGVLYLSVCVGHFLMHSPPFCIVSQLFSNFDIFRVSSNRIVLLLV